MRPHCVTICLGGTRRDAGVGAGGNRSTVLEMVLMAPLKLTRGVLCGRAVLPELFPPPPSSSIVTPSPPPPPPPPPPPFLKKPPPPPPPPPPLPRGSGLPRRRLGRSAQNVSESTPVRHRGAEGPQQLQLGGGRPSRRGHAGPRWGRPIPADRQAGRRALVSQHNPRSGTRESLPTAARVCCWAIQHQTV
eukprot:COSAG01_NODE_3284_length_6309_cov_82.162802_6_plen_190_part_00